MSPEVVISLVFHIKTEMYASISEKPYCEYMQLYLVVL